MCKGDLAAAPRVVRLLALHFGHHVDRPSVERAAVGDAVVVDFYPQFFLFFPPFIQFFALQPQKFFFFFCLNWRETHGLVVFPENAHIRISVAGDHLVVSHLAVREVA